MRSSAPATRHPTSPRTCWVSSSSRLPRSVNVIIWALIFVVIFGPGALAGVLAISIRSIGFTAKLIAEAIEEIDRGSVEAITAAGASPVDVLISVSFHRSSRRSSVSRRLRWGYQRQSVDDHWVRRCRR
nr:ABC transporter permease subunit [Haloarcula sp. CBA1129]